MTRALTVTQGLRHAAAGLTPARVFQSGVARGDATADQLTLRADHAAARDAVSEALDLSGSPMVELVARYGLFEVQSKAASTGEHLLRPDLGRELTVDSQERLQAHCDAGRDLQIVIGDGLSATAVHAHAPALLERLRQHALLRGWSWGRPFAVAHCRVGIMNDVGEILKPQIVVLLIGERPGLTTAESLSAYVALRPRHGHTDADRNLISNIHPGGTPVDEAALRLADLLRAMRAHGRSGHTLKQPDVLAYRPAQLAAGA